MMNNPVKLELGSHVSTCFDWKYSIYLLEPLDKKLIEEHT